MTERIIRFGDHQSSVGVLTEPAGALEGTPAFLLLNAGIIHRVGPNRLNVGLARALARAGFLAVRFDLSGLGDSDVRHDGLPYHRSRVSETVAVMDYLSSRHGAKTFVLLGLCSGADHAFRVANADKRVVGAVMIDGYAYHTFKFYVDCYLLRLLRWQTWWRIVNGKHPVWQAVRRKLSSANQVNAPGEAVGQFVVDRPPKKDAESQMRALIARNVHFLFIYAMGFARGVRNGWYRGMHELPAANGLIETELFEDSTHTFTRLSDQQALVQRVCEWAVNCFMNGVTVQQHEIRSKTLQ